MEKWKIGAILGLIGMLVGYGAYQNAASTGTAIIPPGLTPPTPAPIKKLLGQPARPWNIPAQYWTNTSAPVTLQSLKGNVALIEFFRIECPHCQDAIPFMIHIYQTYSPAGLKMVAIQAPGTYSKRENNWAAVQSQVKTWELPYPIAFDEHAHVFTNSYKGTTFPTVIVLDRKGVMRYINTGDDDDKEAALEDAVKKQLQSK